MSNWSHVHRPTLILSEARCRRNIRHMLRKADACGKILRPHMKSHQSKMIGRWMREEGIDAITVSSVGMAEYFASDFWQDITIAFPCNLAEVGRINDLAETVRLTLMADRLDVVQALERKLHHPVNVVVEIDSGYGRTGIPYTDADSISAISRYIRKSRVLGFGGYYSHAGHTYDARSAAEVEVIAKAAVRNLEIAVGGDKKAPVIFGDTPSCSVLDDFGDVVTHLGPGNFVLYDLAQVEIGSCTLDDIAILMACPVVTLNGTDAMIYGGGAHFCKDKLQNGTYGVQVRLTESDWVAEETGILRGISQEIGKLETSDVQVGDIVGILPVHACMTAEMMGKFLTLDGLYVDHYLKSR